jgi:hypothetical protein
LIYLLDKTLCQSKMIRQCGFRSSNSYTNSGWASTIGNKRTTDLETDEAMPCSGNVNWLNYKGPNFKTVHTNTLHQIKRKAFRAGQVFEQGPVDQLKVNRNPHTDHINRPAFQRPPVTPRKGPDFDQINMINIAQFGKKVQLGEATLQRLLGVRLPDPLDRAWLDEKARLKAAGKTPDEIALNPPFGRQQRTTNKQINFGEASLGLQGKLAAIKTMVAQNRVENREEKRLLGVEIERVLKSNENLHNLTSNNLVDLKKAVDRLHIPLTYQENGFTHRLFSNQQYLDQQGLITMFLLANPRIHNINTPIRSEKAEGSSEDVWVGLNTMVAQFRTGKVLDLEERRFIFGTTADILRAAGADDEEKVKSDPAQRQGKLEFITDELKAAMPRVVNWKKFAETRKLPALANIYHEVGLNLPDSLIDAFN